MLQRGRAQEVVNVDTSRSTLDWAAENAAINDLSLHFSKMDAREFVDMALRQKRRYDLIIVDPPSFARSKRGVFKIAQDLPQFIEKLSPLLNTNGQILLSTNYEEWSQRDFMKQMKKVASQESFTLTKRTEMPKDFESSTEEPLLKFCFLQR